MSDHFNRATGLIFDLDNTLYRYGDDFIDICNRAAAKTVLEMGLQKTEDEAFAMAIESYRTHAHSFRVFADMGFEYRKFHDTYHESVSIDTIIVLENLRDELESLPHKQVILTNASRAWTNRIITKTQLHGIFQDHNIVCLEDIDFKAKAYYPDGFLYAKERGGMKDHANENIIVVEDVSRNLVHAKALGMQTALVHGESDDAHIDHRYADVLDFVRALKP